MDQSLDFIERAALCVNLCGGAINAGVGVLAADNFVTGVYSDQPARDRNERHRGANQVAVGWIARPINPCVYDLDKIHHDLQKFPTLDQPIDIAIRRRPNRALLNSTASGQVGISDGQPHPTACQHSYQMLRLPFLRACRQPSDRSQRRRNGGPVE
jgi:hypothetical protein